MVHNSAAMLSFEASEMQGAATGMEAGKTARKRILELISEHVGTELATPPFVPGETPVPVSGKVFGTEDVSALVDAALDFWLTTGRYAETFSRLLARYLGVRAAILCNSGSSANLLAVAALTSPRLGERRLRVGDEIVTPAAGFPTTVNPIVQHGLVPVFVDVELGTYDVRPEWIESALGPRTKAIMMAHTLGNPFDAEAVRDIATRHGLWLVEDNCDALGSTFNGRLTGTFGDMATLSFYPAHHITTGEGGAVATDRPMLRKVLESFRDWGRDCWCEPGKDNTCYKRFDWQLGDLPPGYDHKYVYSHIGYNLKMTDMQAAVGSAQIGKLASFTAARRHNWQRLRDGLAAYDDFLVLPEPTPGSDPSWFGFALTVRPGAPFTRRDLVSHLEACKIGTRQLFGGNLARQPAYSEVNYRVADSLDRTDEVMRGAFWIGVYPGITDQMVDYVLDCFAAFMARTAVPR
jgi:CDP-6-deoxy-D-xylo-4-hexulose-3-dehydrase